MAQRSHPARARAPQGNRPRPTGRSWHPRRSDPAPARRAASRPAADRGNAAGGTGRPPPRKPGKSIVNQKQTPWGLIATTVVVVLFAGAIVVVVVAPDKDKSTTTGSGSTTNGRSDGRQERPVPPAGLPAAMTIKGVTYRVEGRTTTTSTASSSTTPSPPVGGNHSQFWADCTGIVYDHQIANENAVHMLEHGAVWITYNPRRCRPSQLATLKKYVNGVDRMALTPVRRPEDADLAAGVGLPAVRQLGDDPRIEQFIATLKYNPKTTPENASCSDPYFKASDEPTRPPAGQRLT